MLEYLQDDKGFDHHLNLTYAVRDGIIAHCGEVNQQCLRPRGKAINLKEFSKARRFEPYTWEGCVVKLSDKMAYLGRDLEDAKRLGMLDETTLKKLQRTVKRIYPDIKAVNNTNLIHTFIIDLCRNSSVEDGLRLSDEGYELMKTMMRFNYEHIYKHPRLMHYDAYAKLVLTSLFEVLSETYDEDLEKRMENLNPYPRLAYDFSEWMAWWDFALDKSPYTKTEAGCYRRAAIDFLSMLTDRGVLDYYAELTTF